MPRQRVLSYPTMAHTQCTNLLQILQESTKYRLYVMHIPMRCDQLVAAHIRIKCNNVPPERIHTLETRCASLIFRCRRCVVSEMDQPVQDTTCISWLWPRRRWKRGLHSSASGASYPFIFLSCYWLITSIRVPTLALYSIVNYEPSATVTRNSSASNLYIFLGVVRPLTHRARPNLLTTTCLITLTQLSAQIHGKQHMRLVLYLYFICCV